MLVVLMLFVMVVILLLDEEKEFFVSYSSVRAGVLFNACCFFVMNDGANGGAM
jgi:hypothetical protein